MSYSVYGDVAAEFKSMTFSSTSAVTDTQVTEFIAQADAIIDGRIGLKYTLPVTDTAGLKILKAISIAIVSDRVRDIMKVMTGQAETSQQARPRGGSTVPAGPYQMLKDIIEGNLKLGNQALASTVDGISSGTIVDDVCPVFDADLVQW